MRSASPASRTANPITSPPMISQSAVEWNPEKTTSAGATSRSTPARRKPARSRDPAATRRPEKDCRGDQHPRACWVGQRRQQDGGGCEGCARGQRRADSSAGIGLPCRMLTSRHGYGACFHGRETLRMIDLTLKPRGAGMATYAQDVSEIGIRRQRRVLRFRAGPTGRPNARSASPTRGWPTAAACSPSSPRTRATTRSAASTWTSRAGSARWARPTAFGSGKFDFGVRRAPARSSSATQRPRLVSIGARQHYDATWAYIALADCRSRRSRTSRARKLGVHGDLRRDTPSCRCYCKNGGHRLRKAQRVAFDSQVIERGAADQGKSTAMHRVYGHELDAGLHAAQGFPVSAVQISRLSECEALRDVDHGRRPTVLQKEPAARRRVSEATPDGGHGAGTLRNPDEAIERHLTEHPEIGIEQQRQAAHRARRGA